MKISRVLTMAALALLSLFPAAYASPSGDPMPETARRLLEKIPVQHEGRLKPFRSFAQETALYITGRQNFQKRDAVDLVWEWMAYPEKASSQAIIPVTHPKLREFFGLKLVHHRLSPEIVLQDQAFLDRVREAGDRDERGDILSDLDKKTLEIYSKAMMFKSLADGQVPGILPHPGEVQAGWLPVQVLLSDQGLESLSQMYPPEALAKTASALHAALQATGQSKGDLSSLTPENFQPLVLALEELLSARNVVLDRRALEQELFYLHFRPFHQAMLFYSISFVFGVLLFWIPGIFRRTVGIVSLAAYITAFGIHAFGFYLRCVISGRAPVTNMYESMIWVSWAVALFALVLFSFYRTLFIRNTAALVAAVALLLAQAFPVALNPAISPLVPVLRSNLWLTVHVLTITLSYGAFLLSWGLGHGVLYTFAFSPEKTERQRVLFHYLYRCLQIGVVLLAAGTILGGVWANYSWGRFWGWDPKETWALIALLGYLAVLHARYAGWAGNFGISLGACFAFLGVLMAWYGVNFVLGAGLHSYGFGGGGLRYVMAAIAADAAFLGFLAWRYKRHRRIAITAV